MIFALKRQDARGFGRPIHPLVMGGLNSGPRFTGESLGPLFAVAVGSMRTAAAIPAAAYGKATVAVAVDPKRKGVARRRGLSLLGAKRIAGASPHSG